MNILVIDTSTSACTIALQHQDSVKSIHQVASMQQGRLILPAIHELLTQHGLKPSQLDVIGFGVGPGSFTGIRIASSVVQALGYAAGCQIYPISSLAILAQTAYKQTNCPTALVAVDARMNRVYLAAYRAEANGIVSLLGKEDAHSLADIDNGVIGLALQDSVYAVGDAWAAFPELLKKQLNCQIQGVDASLLPDANAALSILRSKLEQNEQGILPHQALPSYFA